MSCCVPSCAPSCAVPSCASRPVIGLGSCGVGSGFGGIGGIGSGIIGYGGGSGLAASASSLGVLSGVPVSCVNQVPPSEVTIQPPSFSVIIPGAILAASCEPVAVGGYSPCASGSSGYGSLGSGYCGYGSFGLGRGFLGGGGRGICGQKRSYSVCGYPC